MEDFNLNGILSEDEVSALFSDEDTEETSQETPPEQKENNQENDTTEVDVDDIFGNEDDSESPESVGSEENNQETEGTSSEKKGTSPNNVYSSIAKALKEDGILPDLDDDILDKTETPEDFAQLIESQIQARFDEKQKRIDEALGVGVEPTAIQQYERTLDYLDSINDDAISDESEKGENLRKQLIYQDFINRGYSKERATREVNKSFSAGSDIDDAKEALKSNIDYFNDKYEELVNEAKSEIEKEEKNRKEQAEKLKSSILNDKDVFGELAIDKSTRQKIYDNISKPVYKDPESGEYLTAIQKYEMENRTEFLKNVGLLFTLTDGFKNLDGLVKGKVRKEVKKGLRELEQTLNNTSRTPDGNLKFVSGVDEDPESFIGKGYTIDI